MSSVSEPGTMSFLQKTAKYGKHFTDWWPTTQKMAELYKENNYNFQIEIIV